MAGAERGRKAWQAASGFEEDRRVGLAVWKRAGNMQLPPLCKHLFNVGMCPGALVSPRPELCLPATDNMQVHTVHLVHPILGDPSGPLQADLTWTRISTLKLMVFANLQKVKRVGLGLNWLVMTRPVKRIQDAVNTPSTSK